MTRLATALTTCLPAPAQLRMKKLEEIRLEVDSRRRTVADLGAKVEKQRARLPQTRAKGEDEMQNTIKTMQHKENKLAGAALAHALLLTYPHASASGLHGAGRDACMLQGQSGTGLFTVHVCNLESTWQSISIGEPRVKLVV